MPKRPDEGTRDVVRSKLSAFYFLSVVFVASCGGHVTDGPQAGHLSQSGACDLAKAFEAPVLVPGLNASAGERHHPSLSPDELTIYFEIDDASRRGQIYFAVRATRDATFSDPIPLSGIVVPEAPMDAGEEQPTISSDGLTLYFIQRLRAGGKGCTFYAASRAHAGDTFGHPVPVPGLSCVGGFFSADDLALYFDARTTAGSSTSQPRMSRFRSAGAVWLDDGPVISAALDESCGPFGCYPIVSADGLALFFVRASADAPDGKIWSATRATASGPFEPVGVVGDWPGLSTRPLAAPEWLSPDGCRLYATAYSDEAFRGIYVAERGR